MPRVRRGADPSAHGADEGSARRQAAKICILRSALARDSIEPAGQAIPSRRTPADSRAPVRMLAKADAMTSLTLRWSPRRSWRAPLASWSLVLACLVAFAGDVAPAAEPTAGAVLPPPAAITLEAA